MLWKQLVSKKNDAMLTFVFPTMDPFSPEAFSLVDEVRGVLRNQTLEASIPGLTFKTFSPASILMDLIDVTSHRLPLTFLACVLTCLTLVAFWFGAPFLPLKLLLTVAVPITWTYGAALFVYQDGVLASLGVPFPGLRPTHNAGIDWTVPIFTLTFIVGLAMDYEIFLLERIREFREEGFGERESIQLGLAATGDTITCAGLIMALTFVAQLLGSIPVTNQMGFILVFSIAVDTFVVRTILVPAMLSLVPRINHWPSKMPPVRYTWLQGCCGDSDEESSSSSGSSGKSSSASKNSEAHGS
jgi:RND superfamily putative drug exporter